MHVVFYLKIDVYSTHYEYFSFNYTNNNLIFNENKFKITLG